MKPSEAFGKYCARYPLKAMSRAPLNADETRQMTPEDEMRELSEAPVGAGLFVQSSHLPDSTLNAERDRHLWVIGESTVPYALESCAWGAKLETGRIKHSNLTGGNPAHSAGEAWFMDSSSIVLNANSGRYGSKSVEEFEHIVYCFLECGYRVASMGFDIENPTRPNAVLVGSPEWRTLGVSV